jgi:peptide deformylase
MSAPTVIQLGDPTLRLQSESVDENEFGSRELHELTEIMFKAMENNNGIGLAAPQIAINKRVIVFGINEQVAAKANRPIIPYTALINPSYEILSDETEEEYEGCLSVRSLLGKVSRYTRILYKGFNASGLPVENEVVGLHARVVQHECDHLNGVIFLDRVTDHSSLGFREELIAAGMLHTRKTAQNA